MLNSLIGIIASSGGAAAAANSYESIATVTVGAGGASSVSFTSIPSTYQHLQLRIFAQTNRGTYGRDGFYLNFNSDGAANYSEHGLIADGSTVGAFGNINQSEIVTPEVTTSTAGASIFGGFITDVLDYANTSKFKTVRMLGGGDHNGTVAGLGAQVSLQSGSWRSTSAITSMTLIPVVGTSINRYSSFALYGIKG
jgi:hypothetical protein